MNRIRGDTAPPHKRGRFEGGSDFHMIPPYAVQKELESRKNLPPSKVVAAQILNACYPITMRLIQKVFSKFGPICRIVIFNRLSLNVMVEYTDIASADKAVMDLHGMNIYQDCCTIKIEFSKKQELQVNKNSDTELDLTKQPWKDDVFHDEAPEERQDMAVYRGGRSVEADVVTRDWSSWETQASDKTILSEPRRPILIIEPPYHLLNQQKAIPLEQVDRAFLNKDINPPSRILLYSIMNAIFPITTQLIYKISSSFGTVLKIVIFERFSIQVMVEFQNVDEAKEAKSKLHKCDIYPNCCSIKVDYAKKDNIGVSRNDHLTWSSELAGSSGFQEFEPPRRLLPDERSSMFGRSPQDERPPTFGLSNVGMGSNYSNGPNFNIGPVARAEYGDGLNGRFLVSMVYNLNPKMFNCERLFNLLCLYGIVRRILFLKQKNFKTAIVEWADPDCVERVIDCLSNTQIFGQKIQFAQSKKQNVAEGTNDPFLEDGTSAFQDFSRGHRNRFNNWSNYDNIFPPSRTLHFFNTPLMEDATFEELFRSAEAPLPTKIMWFPVKDGRLGDYRTGCLQFDNVADATEALVLVNHATVETNGKDRKKDGKVWLAFTNERQDKDFT